MAKTFEEYLAEQEQSRQQTIGPEERDRLRAEFASPQGSSYQVNAPIEEVGAPIRPVSTTQVTTTPTVKTTKMATLFNPATNQRVAVAVGSPQAQQFFGQGFQLETPTSQVKKEDTTATSTTKTQTDTPKVEQPDTLETQVQGILDKYGVKPSAAQSDFTNFAESYRQVYNSLGLSDVKGQIDLVTKQYGDLQQELGDKISDVNENPWLSEPARKAKVAGLERRYEQRLSNLNSKLTVLNNLHTAGREEAQFITQQGLTERRAGQEVQKDLVLRAIDMAEKQAEAERKLAAGTEKKTEVVKVGNRQILIDKQTGETIKVLGASGNGGEGGVGPVSFDVTSPTTGTSFKEYLAGKENEAGQTFNQARRDALRKEFESQKGQAAGGKQKWLDSPTVDARIKDIIRGTAKFTDYSVTERRALQAQYNQAQNEGVVPKATTAAQEAKFSKLTAKYDQNPVIRQADKAAGLTAIANQVIANPKSSSNQLVALYSLVKQLDPDSAVREGELTLAQSTLSRLEQIGQEITRLKTGQVLPPKQAVEFANAVKQLSSAWDSSLTRINTRFASEARVSGIEDLWTDYTGGFSAPSSSGSTGQTSGGVGYTVRRK